MTLEPLNSSDAVSLYLEDRENELREQTLYAHRSRLEKFVEWCEKEGIENLNTLDGRDLMRFKHWRRDTGGLEPITLNGQLSTLRVFLRFCESINGVNSGLAEQIPLRNLDRDQEVNERRIETDRATSILAYLERFEYASREHALFALAWETALRLGSIQAIDIEDYRSNEYYLGLVHRPDTGTSLKNGVGGERQVNLSKSLCQTLDDYVTQNRPSVTDSEGREPLFATKHGRMATSTIRRLVYQITRPCIYGTDCPHGRDVNDCAARNHGNASKCPSSRSPHAVRRGSIMHQRAAGLRVNDISDRVDATTEVIEKHYDCRTEEQKRKQRRSRVSERLDSYGGER